MSASNGLRRTVLVIGMFLIAISLYCSFLLYTSFSEELSDQVAWGGMGLGLDAFKNVALVAALALWALGLLVSRLLAVVVFAAYGVLTVLSFMAFFGFMATVQHQLEQEALLASTQYQSLQASAQRAQENVDALSVYADGRAVQEAEQQLQRLQPQIVAAEAVVARWIHADGSVKTNARGLPFATKAREAQAQLAAVEGRAIPHQEVIDGYARYQAALAHQERVLAELAALSPTQVASASTLHPMFVDLGKLVAAAPDEMKVAFMFVSSASAEILGTLSILIAVLLGRQRSMTLDEVAQLTTQLQAQHQRMQEVFGTNLAVQATRSQPIVTDVSGQSSHQDNPQLEHDVKKQSPVAAT